MRCSHTAWLVAASVPPPGAHRPVGSRAGMTVRGPTTSQGGHSSSGIGPTEYTLSSGKEYTSLTSAAVKSGVAVPMANHVTPLRETIWPVSMIHKASAGPTYRYALIAIHAISLSLNCGEYTSCAERASSSAGRRVASTLREGGVAR